MKVVKRSLAFFLSLIMVLSLMTGIVLADEADVDDQAAVAEQTEDGVLLSEDDLNTEEYVEVEEEAAVDPEIAGDNNELLEEYIEVQLSTSNKPMYSVNGAGRRLTGTDRATYDFLRGKAALVASGEIADAQFTLTAAEMGLQDSYTAADLGLDTLGTTATGLTDDTKAAIRNIIPDLSAIVTALLFDCPYDFYWYDKATEGASGMSYGISYSYSSENIVSVSVPQATFSFTVAEEYADPAGNTYKDSNGVSHLITVDSTKTTAVSTAVSNITDIVNTNAGLSDYEKIKAYKNTIDDMVDYNHAAADDNNNTPYGNPWQLIWVFDDDASTKVVCEGYSKAFQYLCDLSKFKNSKVESRIVTGTMSGGTGAGGHMWNVVTMNDEKNYLVDVTNCDSGSIGYSDNLFLVGDENGSVSNGYSIAISGQGTISYSYDTDTINAYDESKLSLAGATYDPTPYLPENCFDYVVLDDGTAELTRFKQSVKEVEIPSVIDGYIVTSIGENAFYNGYGSAVTTVTIPEGITNIGNYAFCDCSALTSISLPESLMSIGNYAFSRCSKISSIELPSGLSNIGDGVFNKCIALTSMTLPEGLTELGGFVFNNCTGLNSVSLPDSITSMGMSIFYNCTSLKTVNIPTNITSIGEGMFFNCSSLSEIVIPSGVTNIDASAFQGCSSFTEVNLPSGLTYVGEKAFYSCRNLTTITIPQDVNTIGEYAFGYYYDHPNQVKLNDFIIYGNSGTAAEQYATANEFTFVPLDLADYSAVDAAIAKANALERDLYTTESLQAVDDAVAAVVEGLPISRQSEVDAMAQAIEDAITSLVERYIAHGTCGDNLTWTLDNEGTLVISGSGEMDSYPSTYEAPWKGYDSGIKSVLISRGVTSIGAYSFCGCSKLTIVEIPESVTHIGNSAFSGCNIKSVYSDNLANYLEIQFLDYESNPLLSGAELYIDGVLANEIVIPEGITEIKDYSFSGCNNLTSVVIPESVTSIGEGAFYKCSSLTNIVIQDGVTRIGAAAFSNCSKLTNIEIPDGVTSIADGTFSGCSSLTSIEIPDKVTSIGEQAFRDCSKMTSIVIPEIVTRIGGWAFYGCCNITSIVILENVTSFGLNPFTSLPDEYRVYTVHGSYASTQFPADHVRYLNETEEKLENYIGFKTDRIVIPTNGTVSLAEYLVTNQELSECKVSVSDENVFFYDEGIIAALEDGTGTLTISCGDLSASIKLISTSSIIETMGISFSEESVSMIKGDSQFLDAILVPENATNNMLTWSSSDPTIVTVDNGYIKALKSGTAEITVSLANNDQICAVCTVTVNTPLKEIITLEDVSPYTLENGKTQKIAYYLYPYDAENVDLNFTSSVPNIVSIDESGVMTANDNGTAQITISSGDISKTVEVTVYTPITGLAIDKASARASCGDTVQLTVLFEPANTTDRDVTWSSNKEAVATVDENGLVTVHSKGIATITATVGQLSATSNIVCNAHTWDEGKITTEPSCTEQGVKTFTCVCGETYTEEIPATGHQAGEAVIENKVDATCEKDGSYDEVVYCTVCEKELSRETKTIPATGHHWNEDYTIDKEATCSEEGSKSLHCSVCGEIKEDSIAVIPKVDHAYGEWVVTKAATCEEAGSRQKTCSVCGDVVTEEIPATGHQAGEAVIENKVDATCEKDGSYDEVVYCTVCEKELSRETKTIPAIGHHWNEDYTIDKEATCAEEGSKSIHCSVCGEIKEDSVVVIPKADHAYGEWVVTKEATCEEAGTRQKICSVCGDVVTEVIPATGHQTGEAVIENKVDATCEKDGSYDEVVYCTVCEKELSRETKTIPAAGHHWNEDYTIDKAATCAEEGSKSIHCSVCGEIKEGSVVVIPKADHAYGEWVVTKEATCEEPGSRQKTCSVCGDIVTEAIPATGHQAGEAVIENKVDATCEKDGSYDEVIYCTVCEKELSRETKTIPVIGHHWNEDYTIDKEATCAEEGSKSIHCSVCDEIKEGSVVVIPKADHAYGEWVVTKEATCEEAGSRQKTCSVCGDVVTEAIPATDHQAGEAVIENKVEATCEKDGSYDEVVYCTVCEKELSRETKTILAAGHHWNEDYTIDKAATCAEEGSKSIHCSVCDEIKEGFTVVIPKADHAYGDWVVTKEATCEEAGSRQKTCSVCGDVVTEAIPAIGHSLIKHDAVAPDYAHEGNKEYWECEHCGKFFKDAEGTKEATSADWIIPKLIPEDGWITIEGSTYYYENGAPKTGWFKEEGNWYYLDPTTGAMQTGFATVSGKTYYMNPENGIMKTGWIKVNDIWYYADGGGAILTGWVKVGTTWYFMNNEGAMQTGWVQSGSTWYYMNPSGAMATGWVKVNDTWYYMASSGAMTTGWQKIGTTWYFMKPSGAMAASEWYNGYWLSASGAWTYQQKGSWKQSGGRWWFGDTSGWYAKNETLKINDKYYTFDASGYLVE